MIRTINNKYFLFLLLLIYTLIGIYLSLTTGITSDESGEHRNWIVNLSYIQNLFKEDSVVITDGNRIYENFLQYQDKYHGIGFHYISIPIQSLIYKFVAEINDVSLSGAYLLSKHAVAFLVFSISGIFFYLISLRLISDKIFAFISTAIYLLYPYLFGHSQFNVKDIPFLSFWIINSYFLLTIIEDLFNEKKISYNKVLLLSLFTAFLISIRTLGLIIFLQYLISLIILFNVKKINFFEFVKRNFNILIVFILSTLLLIYLLNPIFWENPYQLVLSIKWMSKYFNNICTLTLGDCMSSLSLPSSYYFIWLFFKLPILILLGLAFFPIVEKKIFNQKILTIYYGTLLFSTLAIIFIFILLKINIYDELRHVMFLFPMIFLISLVNIYYFNRKIFYTLGSIVIIFFILENKSLNPYQYTWLNSFSKFTNIQKNFEIDYWGVSGKNLQKKIIEYSDKNFISKDACVFGDEFVKDFLITKGFSCFKRYQQIDEKRNKPIFAYKNLRNAKRSDPKDCKLIWNETYRYSFYNKDISVGTLWWCD